MPLPDYFPSRQAVDTARGTIKRLEGLPNLKQGKQNQLAQAQGLMRRRTHGRIGLVLAASLTVGGINALKTSSPQHETTSVIPTEGVPTDIATPEVDPQIELPEFSINKINYKPSVPAGLDMNPLHFKKISKDFFDYIEKDFSKFEKDFGDANNPQKKGQLVKDHIVKYYDHLLSLDPKIRANASSKSMGTLNERCSYMTLFLIGQGRYISVMNPDSHRPYPQLLYGESHINDQIDINYKGQGVKLPIVEIDAHTDKIPRAWYDYNNQLMIYSPAQNLRQAQAMVGNELNVEQVAEFAAVMRESSLKHEGTHALTQRMFPKSLTDKSLRSGHNISLEKIQIPKTQKDQRHAYMQGLEIGELTALGINMVNLPGFLKLYLASMTSQVANPTQHQQAHLHFLTYLANRQTVPLPLRLKVQAFLAVFPRGNPSIISEVMRDPSLPEAELVEIGKQLFATGIHMFEQTEHE